MGSPQSSEEGTPSGSRVAVIVVAGVGDDRDGQVAKSVAGALAAHRAPGAEIVSHRAVVPVGAQYDDYEFTWLRITPAASAPPAVDVYEMRWSDLSRFPGAAVAFLAALFQVMLQMPSHALEAIARVGPHGRLKRLLAALIRFLSWWLAVPVLIGTGVIALMVVAVAGLAWIAAHTSGIVGGVAAGALLLALTAGAAGLAAWTGGRLRQAGWGGRGWWSRPRLWGPAFVAGTALLVVARRVADDPSTFVAVANTLAWHVSLGMRAMWTVVVLAAAAAAVVAWAWFWSGRSSPDRTARRRALLTVLAVIILGPAGTGLVSLVPLAAAAGLAQVVADDYQLTSTDQSSLLCFADEPWSGVAPCSSSTASEADTALAWGNDLFEPPFVPAAAGLVMGLVLMLLLAVYAAVAGWRGRVRGGWLSAVLRSLGSPSAMILVTTGILVGAVVIVRWAWDPARGLPVDSDVVGTIGISVTVAAVVWLGLGRLPLPGGGVPAAVGGLFDLVADVTTWRAAYRGDPPRPTPRERMIARYGALLSHVTRDEADPYDGLVILAHSQGNVITAGALFGDPFGTAEAELARRQAGIRWPKAVSWLSVGNPLGQSYRARLPLHYEWVIEPDRRHGKWVDEANVDLRPLTRYWINLYRSYDYIGRALWREDPCDEEVTSDAWHSPAPAGGGGVILRERCIGGGGHTGYWRLPIVIEELSTLIDDAHRFTRR